MNLSMNWLKDFVDTQADIKTFCDAMTLSGSKVELYDNFKNHIQNVVVGRVESVVPHPNADSLVICKVDVGEDEPKQIVTGATNVTAGCVVPVALHGSLLPDGTEIRRGKLRGEVSEGMLCSLGELGLTAHNFPYAIEDGIFLLEEECTVGQDICSALGLDDNVVEFEITPNRPDCLSVIGLAREASATFAKPLSLPSPTFTTDKTDAIQNYLQVTVKEPELCPRYSARVIKNIKIEPSPRWLRNRLHACGIRPINNIVDITNYIMLEYGQPMHAFDYACLDGQEIIVRLAKDGEIFNTLDGQERGIDASTLVIADGKKSVALAGVMGGANSEITENTKTVVFESACFNGASIRKTSRKVGLRTDSSGRFEKGLDPQNTMAALDRACQLVEMLGAGDIVEGTIDVNNDARPTKVIALDPAWINAFLGMEIDTPFMIEALRRLQFTVDDQMNVTVPSFRDDVEHKADLAEEIVRMYGYDKIPSTLVNMPTTQGMATPRQAFTRAIHQTMIGLGYSEIATYSFISPKFYDKIRMAENDPRRNSIIIRNPLGEDTSIMRTTGIPSLLDILAKNYNYRNTAVKMYELSRIYLPDADTTKLPDERDCLVMGAYGADTDFFTLKGALVALLEQLGFTNIRFVPLKDDPTFHPGRTASVYIGDTNIGVLGEIHPQVYETFEIGVKTYVASVDTNTMFEIERAEKSYHPLPKFPAITRDIALLCNKEITVQEITDIVTDKGGTLLESVRLFDVYSGSQIPENCVSLAFNLSFRSAEETLSDDQVEKKMSKILAELEKIGAKLR